MGRDDRRPERSHLCDRHGGGLTRHAVARPCGRRRQADGPVPRGHYPQRHPLPGFSRYRRLVRVALRSRGRGQHPVHRRRGLDQRGRGGAYAGPCDWHLYWRVVGWVWGGTAGHSADRDRRLRALRCRRDRRRHGWRAIDVGRAHGAKFRRPPPNANPAVCQGGAALVGGDADVGGGVRRLRGVVAGLRGPRGPRYGRRGSDDFGAGGWKYRAANPARPARGPIRSRDAAHPVRRGDACWVSVAASLDPHDGGAVASPVRVGAAPCSVCSPSR